MLRARILGLIRKHDLFRYSEYMINKPSIIAQTAAYIEKEFSHDTSGHDWWHMYRVWQLALRIGTEEKADLRIVQLAALLHDLDDFKFVLAGESTEGAPRARKWMESLSLDEATITNVLDIVEHVSFKGAGVADGMQSLEGKVVQDADRLDAIGAIGIARTFAYGATKQRAIHDPNLTAQKSDSFADYKKNQTTTINHFAEKLLLIKDRMHTTAGKRLAEHRHQIMEDFLTEFHAEWEAQS